MLAPRSMVRSWLIDLMEAAHRDEEGLDRIPAYVDDTGELPHYRERGFGSFGSQGWFY